MPTTSKRRATGTAPSGVDTVRSGELRMTESPTPTASRSATSNPSTMPGSPLRAAASRSADLGGDEAGDLGDLSFSGQIDAL